METNTWKTFWTAVAFTVLMIVIWYIVTTPTLNIEFGAPAVTTSVSSVDAPETFVSSTEPSYSDILEKLAESGPAKSV